MTLNRSKKMWMGRGVWPGRTRSVCFTAPSRARSSWSCSCLSDLKLVSRRQLVRKGARAAYAVPLVMAAVNATERPAFAQSSCNDKGVPDSCPDEDEE